MPINIPDSFGSVGKAKMPDAGSGDEGTILKIEGEDNVVITPSTGQGNVTVALSVDTAQVTVPSPTHSGPGVYWSGAQIITGLSSGQTLTPGKMYYYAGIGQWQPAEAGTDGNYLYAVCPDSPTDGSEMVYKGMVQINQQIAGGGSVLGLPLYMTSSGTYSTTKPSGAGEWVRIVGYLKSSGATNDLAFIDVSNDYYRVPV